MCQKQTLAAPDSRPSRAHVMSAAIALPVYTGSSTSPSVRAGELQCRECRRVGDPVSGADVFRIDHDVDPAAMHARDRLGEPRSRPDVDADDPRAVCAEAGQESGVSAAGTVGDEHHIDIRTLPAKLVRRFGVRAHPRG